MSFVYLALATCNFAAFGNTCVCVHKSPLSYIYLKIFIKSSFQRSVNNSLKRLAQFKFFKTRLFYEAHFRVLKHYSIGRIMEKNRCPNKTINGFSRNCIFRNGWRSYSETIARLPQVNTWNFNCNFTSHYLVNDVRILYLLQLFYKELTDKFSVKFTLLFSCPPAKSIWS